MITKEEQIKNIDNEIKNIRKYIDNLEYYKKYVTDMDYNIDELTKNDNISDKKVLFLLGHPKKLELYYVNNTKIFTKTINLIADDNTI